MTTPTASKLALLNICAWWARPEVKPPPVAPGRYALMGTALHAHVEHSGDAFDTLAPLTDSEQNTVLEWYRAWVESEWAATPWEHEVAFAYSPDTDTARILGRGRDAYASALPGEFTGTADLVFVDREADEVWVPDIKTGFQAGLAPVAENPQLRFLGLAAARAYGVSRARILILHLNGDLTATECVLDEMDLPFVASDLRAALASIPTSEPQPGAHCTDKWCPAVSECPRATALARRAVPVEYPLAPATSDAHALWLRDGSKVLREMAERMETWAKEYADAKGGVAEPDGGVWGKKTVIVERIVFDGPGAAEALDAMDRMGMRGAVETVVKADKKAIEAAVREKTGLKGKALAEAVNEALVPLRVAGVMKPHEQTRYETRKKRGEG